MAAHHCCTHACHDLAAARLARPRQRQQTLANIVTAAAPAAAQAQHQCRQLHSSSSSGSISSRRRAGVQCCSALRFVLYTKPECPLCDGLQDKLRALIDRAAFAPSFLSGASLEVRDISSNAAWQDAMHLAVPVLAVLLDSSSSSSSPDAAEAVLPRPPPRVPAERLQRHLRDALEAAGVDCGGGGGGGDGGGGGGSAFTVVS